MPTEVRRILLVDDEPLVTGAMRNVLRRHHRDWALEVASDARMALAVLSERGPFDVVVSDIHMPGPDGEDLFRWLAERCPAVRRIALTGDIRSQKALRVARLCHGFVEKSRPASDVEQAIARSLARISAAR